MAPPTDTVSTPPMIVTSLPGPANTAATQAGPHGLWFSHVGFFVNDIERMRSFYQGALGFTCTDRGWLGAVEVVFLSREPSEHHQIALMSGRPAELPFNPINQISLRVGSLAGLRHFRDRLRAHGAGDLQVTTHGNAVSVYARDPEGNRLELFLDTPWYCEQPLREPVDLSRSDEEVMAQAEAIARSRPRFMPRAQWQQAMAERMADDQA